MSQSFHSDADVRAKLGDLAGVVRYLEPSDRKFAEGLIKKGSSERGIREVSYTKVDRLWRDACRRAVLTPREREVVGVPHKVVALLEKAARSQPDPIIAYYRHGQGVALKGVPKTSKLPGILDVSAAEDGRWFGRVTPGGDFVKAREMRPDEVDQGIAMMLEFSRDPKAAAKRSARETGRCCFCDSGLDEPEDVDRGWHGRCAHTWGLPF